ncbi:SGNH/GDSL hydrolase family protein [Echinicola shivajiensis]|uniref:SGNH/GDSL hydrolase family protein n=1 Tax=Echinicola shivajiensis TaxID=1035916 RepID=UPI001FE3E30A|nr:SGNH/GDSL hydrolase family protein [Echinicola shivajiensis]
MKKDGLSYLALGDSYTIGEGVKPNENYPHQLVSILEEYEYGFASPKIIATTGWTTDELQNGISATNIEGNTYDLVTLLIGVNNQYRGRTVDNFKEEFSALLDQAIEFAGGSQTKVIVISIPDWGVTSFASQQNVDQQKVAEEITAYNAAKQQISNSRGVHYLDITQEYRQIGSYPENQAEDGLHPSGRIYSSWAKRLANLIREEIRF